VSTSSPYQFEWISHNGACRLEDGGESLRMLSFGGWVDGHSLREFAADYFEALRPLIMAAGKHVTDGGVRLTGRQHQSEPKGALRVTREDGGVLFTDDEGKAYTVATFAGSFRAWGDFIAAAWNTHNEAGGIPERFSYMDFYY